MAGTAATGKGAGNGSSSSPDVQNSIAQYKKAEDESTAESMKVSTQITKINGTANAIKKISPG